MRESVPTRGQEGEGGVAFLFLPNPLFPDHGGPFLPLVFPSFVIYS